MKVTLFHAEKCNDMLFTFMGVNIFVLWPPWNQLQSKMFKLTQKNAAHAQIILNSRFRVKWTKMEMKFSTYFFCSLSIPVYIFVEKCLLSNKQDAKRKIITKLLLFYIQFHRIFKLHLPFHFHTKLNVMRWVKCDTYQTIHSGKKQQF